METPLLPRQRRVVYSWFIRFNLVFSFRHSWSSCAMLNSRHSWFIRFDALLLSDTIAHFRHSWFIWFDSYRHNCSFQTQLIHSIRFIRFLQTQLLMTDSWSIRFISLFLFRPSRTLCSIHHSIHSWSICSIQCSIYDTVDPFDSFEYFNSDPVAPFDSIHCSLSDTVDQFDSIHCFLSDIVDQFVHCNALFRNGWSIWFHPLLLFRHS